MSSLLWRPFLRLLWPPLLPGSPSSCRFSVLSNRDWVYDSIHEARAGIQCGSFRFSTQSSFGRRGRSTRVGGSSSAWYKCGRCAAGVHSLSHSCCGEDLTGKSKMQAVRVSAGDGLPIEAEEEGFEKWKRGGGAVHSLAQVDATVVVEVGAVVHAHAVVGSNSHISSGSIVGPYVNIGSDTTLGFNVALQNCTMGDSCTLHSGVCVGQDGFGFTINEKGEVVKKPQLLGVQIGSFVEIGANTCIDRGSWRDTVIGDHTKIDNLVQIGHNVVIGRCCLLCGQVGLGGSSTLGDYVVMGGKSGVSDHISVTSKVRIAAKSAVISHIVEPGDYAGFPAVPAREWRRSVVAFKKLGKQTERVTRENQPATGTPN